MAESGIFGKITIMDLATRKIEFVQHFLEISDEQQLEKLEDILYSDDFGKSLKPMSLKEFYDGIDQAKNDAKNGRYKSVEELLEPYEK